MSEKRSYERWTEDKVIQSLNGFTTMDGWRKANPKAFAAYDRFIKINPQFKTVVYGLVRPAQQSWTDFDLQQIALKYSHTRDWKKSDYGAYQATLHRGRGFFNGCKAHMTTLSNPYITGWDIYACEFSDHYAYVGVTWNIKNRKSAHYQEGPIFQHLAYCPDHEFKIVAHAATTHEAKTLEQTWTEKYLADGWCLLNSAEAGSLGGINGSWNKQKVLADAQLYPTTKHWLQGNRYVYQLAKKQGWFEEATRHMSKEHYQRWDKSKILDRIVELGVDHYKNDFKLMAAIKRLKVRIELSDTFGGTIAVVNINPLPQVETGYSGHSGVS